MLSGINAYSQQPLQSGAIQQPSASDPRIQVQRQSPDDQRKSVLPRSETSAPNKGQESKGTDDNRAKDLAKLAIQANDDTAGKSSAQKRGSVLDITV
jgi:hypothetical protein